jgi:hypothetical protein
MGNEKRFPLVDGTKRRAPKCVLAGTLSLNQGTCCAPHWAWHSFLRQIQGSPHPILPNTRPTLTARSVTPILPRRAKADGGFTALLLAERPDSDSRANSLSRLT